VSGYTAKCGLADPLKATPSLNNVYSTPAITPVLHNVFSLVSDQRLHTETSD